MEVFISHGSTLFSWCQSGRVAWCLESNLMFWQVWCLAWCYLQFVVTKHQIGFHQVHRGYCWHYDACVVLDGSSLVTEQAYGNLMNPQVSSEVIEWWNIILEWWVKVLQIRIISLMWNRSNRMMARITKMMGQRLTDHNQKFDMEHNTIMMGQRFIDHNDKFDMEQNTIMMGQSL